jgi:hypothetical protein
MIVGSTAALRATGLIQFTKLAFQLETESAGIGRKIDPGACLLTVHFLRHGTWQGRPRKCGVSLKGVCAPSWRCWPVNMLAYERSKSKAASLEL